MHSRGVDRRASVSASEWCHPLRNDAFPITIAKSNFRKGGANVPVCRDARQRVAHLFGNYFWQPL
jgi:hypothetical protein